MPSNDWSGWSASRCSLGSADEETQAQTEAAANPSRRGESRWRQRAKCFLGSKTKHYLVMGLVASDVASILADIFFALTVCDGGQEDRVWIGGVSNALHVAGIVTGSLFLLELAVTIWALGSRIYRDWFQCIDGVVIVVSFVIDLLAHSLVEKMASLVIMLRLWRFGTSVEELSLGASERIEEMQEMLDKVEDENRELKA